MTTELNLLKEWQERLGLQDWAIKLAINCKQEDLSNSEWQGENQWNSSIKCSTIKIVSPEVYGDNRIMKFDFEKTLVHKLLHIKFGLLDIVDSTYESNVVEGLRHQLIDDLARALVMAKRGETKRKLACDIVTDMNIENYKKET